MLRSWPGAPRGGSAPRCDLADRQGARSSAQEALEDVPHFQGLGDTSSSLPASCCRCQQGKIETMNQDPHGAEEVILFPDLVAASAVDRSPEGPRSSYELLEAMGNALPPAGLREWLAVQLAQLEKQARKQPGPPKPAGITSDLAVYIQAREVQAARKATKDAFMRALNKLDHFTNSEAGEA